ncbi:lipid storage droplets surface-binding protein 2 isoform X2 [Orussus abietinus]|nr:lipid storage droplets surface-binding protein 2 isoform X2 [Orussus abietinus]XP_012288911.1 lipid storage droplets surface-binding protein 2 isoform X2 [Orussus abietinus]
MATNTMGLPQFQAFQRVLELPFVEMALSLSASTYSKVKDSNQLLHWTLSTAESSLTSATKQAMPIAVPIVKKLEAYIHFVDHTLCQGLDKIEEKVPMVKEKPELILENAFVLALQTVEPAVSTVLYANDLIQAEASSLKDVSWNKVNEMLDTHYGSVTLHGIDSTAVIVDKLIDQYFPAIHEESEAAPVSVTEDKLLNALQTVGRLSNKAARRVYSTVVLHLRTLKEDDVREYVGYVVRFLGITSYLFMVNKTVQAYTSPKKVSN